MKKILIIGQAPPAVKQYIPYDTTLLYDILGWVGVDITRAQELFEFEAMTDKFPGFDNGGHAKPSIIDMREHYVNTLMYKINNADKILLLGAVPREFFFGPKKHTNVNHTHPNKEWLCLIHPSKRNYARIMEDKYQITMQLRDFLTRG